MKKAFSKTLEAMIDGMPVAAQIDFLHNALKRNEALRNQFAMVYAGMQRNSTDPEQVNPEETIGRARDEFRMALEELDFDNMDWRHYRPHHPGYIADYEAWEDFANDHLGKVFHAWSARLFEHIHSGRLLPAMILFMGMYEACLITGIAGAENIFEDLPEALLDHLRALKDEITEAVSGMVLSDTQVKGTLDAVMKHYLGTGTGNAVFLQFMEPLLIGLADSAGAAGHLNLLFERNGTDERLVPQLALKIASFGDDPVVWREKAEEYMELDQEVARQLLDHYWTDDPECFRLKGLKLFRAQPHIWCSYFSELLFPMFDEAFYKEVLHFKTLRDSNIDLYKILREYLTDGEKAKFTDEIVCNDVFRVRVWSIEKRYPEILRLVQKEVLHTYYFTEMILPVLNIYPAEVFELIRIKCDDMMRNHRKRSGYKHIAEWLNLSLNIRGMEEHARHLIHELYHRKPALPALKEEMRKKGVVGTHLN